MADADFVRSAVGVTTATRRKGPGNLGSRRVLEKLGFVFERTFFADDEESVLYRLRSEARSGADSAPARR